METCGIAPKLSRCEFPRPPTPISPRRRESFFTNGMPETLRPGVCGGCDWASPAPAAANDANRNRSRREDRLELRRLPPESVNDAAHDGAADEEHYQQSDCVWHTPIQE